MAHATSLVMADVIEAYDVFFNRVPESQASAEGHIAVHKDRKSLFQNFMMSAEFSHGLGKAAIAQVLFESFDRPTARIDHEVEAEVLRGMFERIRAQWALLGDVDPYWSVLTVDAFRAENLDEAAVENFWSTGMRHADFVDHFAASTGRPVNRGVCLELGCGVGRVTRHLATKFDRVIAVDVSPENLRLCAESTAGIGLVETVQMARVDDFEVLPAFDLLYSTMVLQHNPPPVQKAILRILFAKVRPGGGVLFQVPTDVPGYEFNADTYLDSPLGIMEMHALPRPVVMEEMRRAGLDIVDVVADPFLSDYGSYTFYGVRSS